MHTPQGLMEHFLKNVRKKLIEADVDSVWHAEVQRVLQDVKAVAKMVNVEHKEVMKRFNEATKKSRQVCSEMTRAGGARPTRLAELQQQQLELEEATAKHAEESGYSAKNQLINGAKELTTAIDHYLTKSKFPKGESEHAFDHGIPILGKVTYRDEFGGDKLTHRDGIQVLEIWNELVDLVSSTYADDQERQTKVKAIMSQSYNMAVPLLVLSKLLKSQEMFDETRIIELEEAICFVYLAYRECYPVQEVFPKLHHVSAHVIDFIKEHGMYGRISEEGFEAIHPKMNKIHRDLKPMRETKKRLETTSNRLQASLNPDVESFRQEYLNNKQGRYTSRPSKYNITKAKSRNSESHSIEYTTFDVGSDDCLEVPSGSDNVNLIKAEWKGVYELVCDSKVPDSWSKVFEQRDDLGNAKKEASKYCGK
jgi:hypothetical protein